VADGGKPYDKPKTDGSSIRQHLPEKDENGIFPHDSTPFAWRQRKACNRLYMDERITKAPAPDWGTGAQD
jgi:hypothetical protein